MENKSILGGCRVLEIGGEKAALCGKILSGMGAEVIRILPPGSQSASCYADTGKHSITLNIKSAKGCGLLRQLVKDADILIESFSPGYLASRGLDYPALQLINERLIMASITGFGQSGPNRDQKTTDLIAGAAGGQVYINGEPGKPPLKPFGTQAYNTAALYAANGIMLAIFDRHNSGRGQYLDISIQECAASALDHVLVRYFYGGEVARRRGSLYWNDAFCIFRCKDGFILLSFLQHWDTLVEWLDSEGLAADLKEPRWQDEAERRRNLDHIIQVIERWTRHHSAAKLVELGQLMRFPWAPVASVQEALDNPQLNERGYWVETTDPESGKKYKFPGPSVKMSGSPWLVNAEFFPPGDYNQEVYQKRLGLSEDEITQLREEGVV